MISYAELDEFRARMRAEKRETKDEKRERVQKEKNEANQKREQAIKELERMRVQTICLELLTADLPALHKYLDALNSNPNMKRVA